MSTDDTLEPEHVEALQQHEILALQYSGTNNEYLAAANKLAAQFMRANTMQGVGPKGQQLQNKYLRLMVGVLECFAEDTKRLASSLDTELTDLSE